MKDVVNKAEVHVPDYVGCFDQVKSVLNSTTKTHSFCEASCVKDLHHFLNKGGIDLAHVQPIKRNTNKSPLGSILVNSPGGVGSTYFMDALPGLGYRTNNWSDWDGLKHQLPFNLLQCLKKKGSPCRAVFSNQSLYEYNIRGKYDGMIIIFDSPAHVIFSLYSRHYEGVQYKKLNRGMAQSKFPTTWDKNVTTVFDAAAKAGNDVFGIERFVHQ